MEAITLKQVYSLLSDVCKLMNENNIQYLVYGSVALNLIKGKENDVHDIDIIVKESDFDKIKNILPNSFNPIQTEFSIHANSKEYIGKDNKPFDISFDSFEHYFQKESINIKTFTEMTIDEIIIKVMPVKSLNKIYSKYSK